MAGTRFLHSGEFHYFRVPRSLWAARLAQLRDVGLNGVSLYVPWNWHMPAVDLLDFTGRTCPERDLVGCLAEIASVGLACVLRPGPFITAEWRGGGIPDWLLGRYPEILARGADGEPVVLPRGYPALTYSHPRYLAATCQWLRDCLGAATPFLAGNSGPIINVQLDDETSYAATLHDPVLTDYNPYLVTPDGAPSRYAEWLLARHGGLDELNAAHHTHYPFIEDIAPPNGQSDSTDSTGEALPRWLDWHDYKISLINEHCALLYQQVRDAGVTEPISMLFPYLLPIQARQFSRFMVERGLSDMWLTNECYLALFESAAISEHKLGAVVATHDSFHMWRQGSAGPPITMELQASNASYITPGSMEMLYAATLARGIRGINYYMMVGGDNPAGFEHRTGRTYDISAPISSDGTERAHCAVIRKLARIIDTFESVLFTAQPSHDVWCGYYLPYEPAAIAGAHCQLPGARELVQDVFSAGEMGMSSAPTVQTLMTLSSVTQGSLDLETATRAELAAAGQLWVLCLEFMSEPVQRKLVDYASAGGHLVVLPGLPSKTERNAPCTVLLDAAMPRGDRPSFPALQPSRFGPAVSIVRGVGDQVLATQGPAATLPHSAGSEVLARGGDHGEPCAVSYPVGEGTITVLGFRLQYTANHADDHQRFLLDLVEGAVGPRTAWSSNAQLVAMQLSGPDGGLLCVVNPTGLPATTVLHWSPTGFGDSVRHLLPTQLDSFTLPDQGARLLPLQRRLRCGGRLHHATWELLAEHYGDGHSALVFHTPGGGTGEVALVGDIAVTEIANCELLHTVLVDSVLHVVIRSTDEEITVHVGHR